jgi:short-subunit dehydrogenase
MKTFCDKTALITGASSGIGYQTAFDLVGKGARLILVARRVKLLEALAGRIQESGGEADVLPCDLSNAAARENLVSEVFARRGCPDLLINNAGYGNYRRFIKETPAEISRMIEVNFTAASHLMSSFLPAMIERGSGAMVNVSSGAGKVALPNMAAYCATKFALCALTDAVSYEAAGSGVTIHLVNPGPVDTEFFHAGVWEGDTHAKMATPAQVSRVIQTAILRNRPVSYVPPHRGLLVYVFNLLGPLGRRVMLRKAAGSNDSLDSGRE